MIFLLFCLYLVLNQIFAPNCILVVCGGLISSEISALNCVFDCVHLIFKFIFVFFVQLGCICIFVCILIIFALILFKAVV